MHSIFKNTKCLVILATLIFSSCATKRNSVSCPSFDRKSKSGRLASSQTDNKNEIFSFKRNQKSNKRILKSSKPHHPQNKALDDSDFIIPSINDNDHSAPYPQIIEIEENDFSVASISDSDQSLALNAAPYLNTTKRNQNKRNNWKAKISKSEQNNDLKIRKENIRGTVSDSIFSKKYSDVDAQRKSKRKDAGIKGGAILLLAVLAGISIPALGTVTASIGLIAILLLDILISIGVIRYYRKAKPKLAKTTGFLRLLYSAIFGLGIGYHIFGNVVMFNKYWSLGLIVFGFHLIALGILFNNEGGKRWINYTIKALLIIAGIGYTLLNVGLLFTANSVAFTALIQPIFIVPQILGEILFALWMIIKGGKK